MLRVYYNQATPHDRGELKLVNWYDANSLGLFKVPLLPSPKDVYRNFEGRSLSIPIIHVKFPEILISFSEDSFFSHLLGISSCI